MYLCVSWCAILVRVCFLVRFGEVCGWFVLLCSLCGCALRCTLYRTAASLAMYSDGVPVACLSLCSCGRSFIPSCAFLVSLSPPSILLQLPSRSPLHFALSLSFSHFFCPLSLCSLSPCSSLFVAAAAAVVDAPSLPLPLLPPRISSHSIPFFLTFSWLRFVAFACSHSLALPANHCNCRQVCASFYFSGCIWIRFISH